MSGKGKSVSCSACHGVNGIAGNSETSNLKEQNEKYFISALIAYKDKNDILQ